MLAWFRLPRMGEAYVCTIIWYSSAVLSGREEDLGSEVVFWLDEWFINIVFPFEPLCSTASQQPSRWRRGSLQVKVLMKSVSLISQLLSDMSG